jgi:putative LysE/RhtB family amino acid efflux pump
MDLKFLTKCFVIGMSAASGVGPIFILTFNRGATGGFFKGFATAIGASFADGLYLILGLAGTLKLIKNSEIIVVMNLLGGVILIALGIRMLNKAITIKKDPIHESESFLLTSLQSFAAAFFNPFLLLFFIFITIQVFPQEESIITLGQLFLGAIAAYSGSLLILGIVAFAASYVGSAIKPIWLKTISKATGLVFVLGGMYLISCFAIYLIRVFIY